MRCSSAARRFDDIDVLKRKVIGSPTPTVLPSPGVTEVISRPEAVSVLNEAFAVVTAPAVLLALATIV